MDSHIQLIGSIVIGGLFLLGVMGFYGNLVDFNYNRTFDLLTQETTASLMEIINEDFRKIGAGVATPASAILANNELTFLGDIDADGAPDTVRYYLSDTTAASATENPNDRILYRVVNGDLTISSPAGVTAFTVTLRDAQGNTTANLMEVSIVDVSLAVQSTIAYNGRYARALWEKRFMPYGLYRFPYQNM